MGPTVLGMSIDIMFKKYIIIYRTNDNINNVSVPSYNDLMQSGYFDFDGKFFEIYVFNNSLRTANGANIEFLGRDNVNVIGDMFVAGLKGSDYKTSGQSAVFRMRKKDDSEFQFIRMS